MKKEEKQEKIETAVDHLSRVLNIMSHTGEKETAEMIFQAIRKDHPTLQQGFFRAIFRVIEQMAEQDVHVDGRNEDSKKNCQRLLAGFKLQLEKEGIPYTDGKPSEFLGFV